MPLFEFFDAFFGFSGSRLTFSIVFVSVRYYQHSFSLFHVMFP